MGDDYYGPPSSGRDDKRGYSGMMERESSSSNSRPHHPTHRGYAASTGNSSNRYNNNNNNIIDSGRMDKRLRRDNDDGGERRNRTDDGGRYEYHTRKDGPEDEDDSRSRSRRNQDIPHNHPRSSSSGSSNHHSSWNNKESHQTGRNTSNNDWKCMECSTWNYPSDSECQRCRSLLPRYSSNSHSTYSQEGGGMMREEERPDHNHDRRSRIRSGEDNDFGSKKIPREYDHKTTQSTEKVDEFGRIITSKPQKKTRWPPCFETNGPAFVFDARSCMFYEANSDFFYDPKSKLYFGNKQRAYFSFNLQSKLFEQCSQADLSTAIDSSRDATDSVAKYQQQGKKISIAINLKTKELPTLSLGAKKSKKKSSFTEKPVVDLSTVASSSTAAKQHVADMDKWSERQVEKRNESLQQQSLETAKVLKDQLSTTAKGEPICMLCRRKFPTLEKLQYHEEVSVLHKENLAKQALLEQQTTTKKSLYLDRAEQRRLLHGPEVAAVSMGTGMDVYSSVVSVGSKSTGDVRSSPVEPPLDSLGETNIGNKLLQKMGWKSDKRLGRPQGGLSGESISDIATPQPVVDLVKKEWDRIESLAAMANDKKPSLASSIAGVGSH